MSILKKFFSAALRMFFAALIMYAALVIYFAMKKGSYIRQAEKEFEIEQNKAEQKSDAVFNANCYLHKRYGIYYPQFYIFSPCP